MNRWHGFSGLFLPFCAADGGAEERTGYWQ
jgi:hypothetical protein